jgi:hypothetical protein
LVVGLEAAEDGLHLGGGELLVVLLEELVGRDVGGELGERGQRAGEGAGAEGETDGLEHGAAGDGRHQWASGWDFR